MLLTSRLSITDEGWFYLCRSFGEGTFAIRATIGLNLENMFQSIEKIVFLLTHLENHKTSSD